MNIPTNLDFSITFTILAYLLIFRLAVIILGGLSIYLGYRLFTQPLQYKKSEQTSELQAKFGNNELTLRSIAPGIFFAAFGVLIIVSVLVGSPPKFDIQTSQDPTDTITYSTNIRGTDDLPATVDATQRQLAEQYSESKKLAQRTLNIATIPQDKADILSILASFAFLEGDTQQAIEYQKQALRELPDDPDLLKRLKVYEAVL